MLKMLNDEIKKNQLKNRQKKIKSTRLTHQTRDMGHRIDITTKKQIIINYKSLMSNKLSVGKLIFF